MSENNGTFNPAMGFIPLSSGGQSLDQPTNPDATKTSAVQVEGNGATDDLQRFRLDQNFDELAPVQKEPDKPIVGRPDYARFFRTKPDACFDTLLLEYPLKEHWFVDPDVVKQIGEEPHLKAKRLYLYTFLDPQSREQSLGLWPVRIAKPGDMDAWNRSAHEIATGAAVSQWVRLQRKTGQGWQPKTAENNAGLPEPNFAGVTVEEVILSAFDGRIIDSYDHEILRHLRGAF